MTPPEQRSRTIRGSAGIVWLLATSAVVVFLLGDVVVRGSAVDAVLIAPWLLLPVWFVWTFLFAPSVHADEDGVVVRNPLRTTRAPWSAVRDIVLRWQIAFVLADGRDLQAWAAAAKRPSGRAHTPQPAERELEILRELREAAADGAAPADGGEVRTSWNAREIGLLAAILIWAAVSVAVTR
ncbi:MULTISPECIES: PH domain-containing protein [Microbacterium]|uniref:PH domain-containing protein n=1 Tax=Microbacterium TaxID=33882 RepID=UPI0022F25ADF|nr:PH domain-containing protein [Microbacterium barkeri]MDR6876338.1 hypothetical protein [Microbacterium barkeri]